MDPDNPLRQVAAAVIIRSDEGRCSWRQDAVVRHLMTDAVEDLMFEGHSLRHGFNDEITRMDNRIQIGRQLKPR